LQSHTDRITYAVLLPDGALVMEIPLDEIAKVWSCDFGES
jgi:hypothetical protein